MQAYARLEQSLCQLFEHVGGMHKRAAWVIFFKINSADARAKMIDKLFRMKYPDNKYSLFRNSLYNHIRPLDNKRNEIAHWNTVEFNAFDNDTQTNVISVAMVSPAWWATTSEESVPRITSADLVNFTRECEFFASIIGRFVTMDHPHVGPKDPDEREAWLQIFAQPIVYPPPPDHPLCRYPLEP